MMRPDAQHVIATFRAKKVKFSEPSSAFRYDPGPWSLGDGEETGRAGTLPVN